jgi:hypothetical protein
MANDWEDHDLVFCQDNGRPISRTEDWREWKTVLKKAGVRDGRLHDARHTAATRLIAQGGHIRVVQEILGHARVTTTERHTHVASPQVRDASALIGAALWGSNETRNAATRSNTLSSDQVTGEGAGGAEARGFEPRMGGKPKPH